MNQISKLGFAILMVFAGGIHANATDKSKAAELPVIVMEQYFIPRYIPHYRIQIFESGAGVYEGFELVSRKGPIKFQISREQVKKIFDEFEKLGFWEMPGGFAKNKAPVYDGKAHRFALHREDRERVILFTAADESWPLRYVFRRIVETEVDSAQWRCPYAHSDTTEVCNMEKSYADEGLKYFEVSGRGRTK
jgi:Domain of unknown function (DUF6438)